MKKKASSDFSDLTFSNSNINKQIQSPESVLRYLKRSLNTHVCGLRVTPSHYFLLRSHKYLTLKMEAGSCLKMLVNPH